MHTTTTPRDILHSTFDPVNLVHFSRVHVVDKEAPPDATGNDLPPIGGEASSEDWEVLQVETLQLGVGVTVDLWERGEGRGKGREVGGGDEGEAMRGEKDTWGGVRGREGKGWDGNDLKW